MDERERYEAGLKVRRAVLGDAHVDAAIERTTEFTAPFQDFITRYAWGTIWAREGLDRRTRSAVTLAVLTAAGAGAHLWRRYQFESAHRLPHVAPGHKCGRMHGHGFAVIVHAQAHPGAQRACLDAGLDARLDITALDRLWAPLHAQLHQACLNDIEGLDNPTSEHIARWIWQRLRPQLQALRWVTVYETATCGAHFDGANYRIWKELGFDSAMRLQRAPAGDGRRRIHGHSYRLRLHLAAPLDQVLGWTIDFGDVKECFAPVLARLDHHPLHELPGVGRGGDRGGDDGEDGAAAIVRWVRGQTAASLPALERIDLDETPGCGVVLCWGPALPALPV